jgi:hypothetical protein
MLVRRSIGRDASGVGHGRLTTEQARALKAQLARKLRYFNALVDRMTQLGAFADR